MTSDAPAPGTEDTARRAGDSARIVIAGGGLAGLRTVEELRALGYAGAITLIGAENRPPYDRPPLSKQLMLGRVDDTTLRAELPDQAALHGAIDRLMDFGLELLTVKAVDPPSG